MIIILLTQKPRNPKSLTGINIDACRIGEPAPWVLDSLSLPDYDKGKWARPNTYAKGLGGNNWDCSKGRFPANILLAQSVADILDKLMGKRTPGHPPKHMKIEYVKEANISDFFKCLP
jgi:hypothetical protein